MINSSKKLSFTHGQLASVRYRLLQILKTIDNKAVRSNHESPSGRIMRLRDCGIIPPGVASLMLVVLTFRNMAEYEDIYPTGNSALALRYAIVAIEEWFSSVNVEAA